MTSRSIVTGVVAALALLIASSASALSPIFTYQGTLEDGGLPANGTYDFQFTLTSTSGSQVAPLVTLPDVPVTGGVFTVQLDFGVGLFGASDRELAIAVRPGPSSDPYTLLSPRTPIRAAPSAQYAIQAQEAFSADDVLNGSIDEVDLATSAVSARTLGTSAVETAKIDDGAVTNAKVADGSITQTRMAGAVSSGTIGGVTIGANGCANFDVSFGGDIQTNDIPLVVMQSGTALPANMTMTALRVKSANVIEFRACNAGNSSASWASLPVRVVTFR